jgi:hypothetical protein
VQDAFGEQILDALDDLSHDFGSNGLLEFSAAGEVGKKIAVRAILGDDVAVCGSLVDFEAFDDVGVVESLQNLNLIVQHLEAGFAVLLEFDDFDGAVGVITVAAALVDLTTVARTNLPAHVVSIAADLPLRLAH